MMMVGFHMGDHLMAPNCCVFPVTSEAIPDPKVYGGTAA
jgi:hypothetical protein